MKLVYRIEKNKDSENYEKKIIKKSVKIILRINDFFL